MEAFKRRVLDIAVDQINEFSDITVKYEQHKKGRSISGFSFSFKSKKATIRSIETNRDPNTTDLFSRMTDKQRHYSLLNFLNYQKWVSILRVQKAIHNSLYVLLKCFRIVKNSKNYSLIFKKLAIKLLKIHT